MKLKKAVKKLGGTTNAAKVAGVCRTTLDYWLRINRWPAWRQSNVDKIVGAAKAASLGAAGK